MDFDSASNSKKNTLATSSSNTVGKSNVTIATPSPSTSKNHHHQNFGTFHKQQQSAEMESQTPLTTSSSSTAAPSVSKLKRNQKRHMLDWITIAIGGGLYLYLEKQQPFHRMFRLDDPTIQFPMAKPERVPNSLCIALAIVVPCIIVALAPLAARRRKNRLHLLHMSILGLATVFVLNGVFTNALKLWLGRPRPDFLSRCMPKEGTPLDQFVGIEVCTNPNEKIVTEGFKSTPSGHSSTSFAGLVYLTLWAGGQLHAFRPNAELYKPILAFLPVVVAFYIAASRTEDYRHHYFDVISGSLIGTMWAIFAYSTRFPWVTSVKCYAPHPTSSDPNNYYLDRSDEYNRTAEDVV